MDFADCRESRNSIKLIFKVALLLPSCQLGGFLFTLDYEKVRVSFATKGSLTAGQFLESSFTD